MSETTTRSPLVVGGALAELPETRWSVVARAGDRQSPVWTAALGQLVMAYRPVLLRHLVVNMRLAPDRAEDFVQAFLADKILSQNVLGQAERAKGRFRSFLLKTFSNYVIGQLRREQALKRRPLGAGAVSLDDGFDPPSGELPLAESFDAIWARHTLALTADRMRGECRAKDRQQVWEVFEARILGPLLDQTIPLPYEQLVERFGLRSPSEASNLLITAKRMFVRVLQAVVRETVSADREVESEIRELKRVLARM